MGRRGPPPKPLEQKVLAGNPGQRRLPETRGEIPLAEGVPTAPEHLGLVGQHVWMRLWTNGAAWLSPSTDWDIIERLCQLHDERMELLSIIADEGRFVLGSQRQRVTHPAVAQLRAVETSMTGLEARCGFNPADRQRLGLKAVQRASKLQMFRKRGGKAEQLKAVARG